MNKRAWLILSDGTAFESKGFGAEGELTGEVVFTTAMTGHQETLTDPNFLGQIVVQTFPIAGSPGMNSHDDLSDYGGAAGLVVREHCELPSNFRMEVTIDEFMKERGIIGLYGIDTRRLTRILREKGTMNGRITYTEPADADLNEIAAFAPDAELICAAEPAVHKTKNAKHSVALIDYGHRRVIVELLNNLGCDVTVVPFTDSVNPADYDGFVLSNGAGNPADCTDEIEAVKALVKSGKPIFGIGLGHQLLAIANGGITAKHKYGHRGANQPVLDLDTGRTYITAQNHGYIVESIPAEAGRITHVSANDRTCEAIAYNNIPALSVQFVPSAEGGVNATVYLIKKFTELMDK
jgi:carbamoyl-phosphate synthase small subunit